MFAFLRVSVLKDTFETEQIYKYFLNFSFIKNSVFPQRFQRLFSFLFHLMEILECISEAIFPSNIYLEFSSYFSLAIFLTAVCVMASVNYSTKFKFK